MSQGIRTPRFSWKNGVFLWAEPAKEWTTGEKFENAPGSYYELKIRIEGSFLNLFIQNTIGFENDHLFEFYAGRNDRNRKIIFSEEPGYPDDEDVYENILLKVIYPLKGLKLYYLFDFGDNWLFEVKKSRKKAIPLKDTEYARIVTENGVKLRQYLDYG